jgi:hypothetical protein
MLEAYPGTNQSPHLHVHVHAHVPVAVHVDIAGGVVQAAYLKHHRPDRVTQIHGS